MHTYRALFSVLKTDYMQKRTCLKQMRLIVV